MPETHRSDIPFLGLGGGFAQSGGGGNGGGCLGGLILLDDLLLELSTTEIINHSPDINLDGNPYQYFLDQGSDVINVNTARVASPPNNNPVPKFGAIVNIPSLNNGNADVIVRTRYTSGTGQFIGAYLRHNGAAQNDDAEYYQVFAQNSGAGILRIIHWDGVTSTTKANKTWFPRVNAILRFEISFVDSQLDVTVVDETFSLGDSISCSTCGDFTGNTYWGFICGKSPVDVLSNGVLPGFRVTCV